MELLPSTSDTLDWLLHVQLLSKGVVTGSEDRGGHPEPHRTETLETNTNRAGNIVVTEAISSGLQLLKVNKKVNAYNSYAVSLTATRTHVPYWIHSVTCHPAEVTFPPLPQPIKAGT